MLLVKPICSPVVLALKHGHLKPIYLYYDQLKRIQSMQIAHKISYKKIIFRT